MEKLLLRGEGEKQRVMSPELTVQEAVLGLPVSGVHQAGAISVHHYDGNCQLMEISLASSFEIVNDK